MSIDVTGQLVIPQNTATIPAAAANSGGNPMICPHTHPKVAPIQNPGTISPPRNPALMVIAVKTIFHTKSRGRALPFIARAINSLLPCNHSYLGRALSQSQHILPQKHEYMDS